MKKLVLAALLGGLGYLAWYFIVGPQGERKLDEVEYFESAKIKLKVSRYYSNYFLHYQGVGGSVQCRSEGTSSNTAGYRQDAGWKTVYAHLDAFKSNTAEELIDEAKRRVLVIDDTTVAVLGNVFQVSFDACAGFALWGPDKIPLELITTVTPPDYCGDKGQRCPFYNFEGERAAEYGNVQIHGPGSVSFEVRSKALKDKDFLLVSTADGGKTWRIDLH